ncbi:MULTISPECIES: SCP-2 sterol transfer family protein [unclassified Acinetobacter]|uniref:SCP-2 sterol transfer family protein n=1 Tax=unclassified Acinetobacter TaxID=196816 RepID=UPI0035BADB82
MINFSRIPVIKLPILDMSTDPFELLLNAIIYRMKYLAKSNSRFQSLIQDRDFIMQIGVVDGVQYYVQVSQQQIRHFKKLKDQAQVDFNLQFADTDYAVKTLSAGDSSRLMKGIQEGRVTVEGDYSLLVWFGKASRLLMPEIAKTAMQNLNQLKAKILK